MLGKKCTKIRNALELSADFYAYVHVEVKKLPFKQARAGPQQLVNYNGAIDFIGNCAAFDELKGQALCL